MIYVSQLYFQIILGDACPCEENYEARFSFSNIIYKFGSTCNYKLIYFFYPYSHYFTQSMNYEQLFKLFRINIKYGFSETGLTRSNIVFFNYAVV